MNINTFTGRLTKDPEPKTTTGGTPVCELRIAVDDRTGTVYVPVTTYGALAESVARYLSKGRLVAVVDRNAHDEWTTAEGQHRSRLYVIARQVEFLDRPPNDNTELVNDDDTDPAN
jgi:single-strand DNA-binding protein